MSDLSLLPPNATPVERGFEAAGARITALPVPVRDTWNPATCPATLLPWLAWALSVDNWDPTWTEGQQRAVIAA
ncbi:phage tail protein I, partial [Meridianimarinicoccus sp. RP-17]